VSVRILYLGSRRYGNLEWSFRRAFLELGCAVRFVDISGTPPVPFLAETGLPYRATMRMLRPFVAPLQERLLPPLLGRRHYDLIFLHKNLQLAPHAIDELKRRTGARVFCFYPDHPFDPHPSRANQHTRGLVPLADCYFTFGRFIMDELRAAGARRIEYLPFAYDPALHSPPRLSAEDRARLRCQVAFVGGHSEERARWLRHLVHVDLGVWGARWQTARSLDARFEQAHRGGEQVGEAFARIYAAADIGLNLIQVYPDGHNMRSYEALACGGFVMSNRTRELVELFREDQELACFDSPAELTDKVSFYLARPQARDRIARAGWERVRGETYVARARRVLAVLDEQGTRRGA
jgi:glycosyltransferase involved in cell wall biosynthesis